MNPHSLEPLEARIAPASLSPSGKTLTYTDIDGDKVTVTFTNAPGQALATQNDFTFDKANPFASNAKLQLRVIDLSGDLVKDGIGFAFAVQRVAGGDGFAHVGHINAGMIDLGKVTLKGDLGRITAGDGDTDPGLAGLTVQSLGEMGLDTQLAGGSLTSNVQGPMGALTVNGNINRAEFNINGTGVGHLASLTVGGSIIGGTEPSSGQVYSVGNIGTVSVKGSLIGGDGLNSGQINAGKSLGAVTIGGSILGGNGGGTENSVATITLGSGAIISGRVAGGSSTTGLITINGEVRGGLGVGSGSIQLGVNSFGTAAGIKIKHSLTGGGADYSGSIGASGGLTKLTIGGSIFGGAGNHNQDEIARGQVYVVGNFGTVSIGHDVRGSTGESTARIASSDGLGNITIGGSLVAGPGMGTGIIQANESSIGAIKITGDIDGRQSGGGSPAGISAQGSIASITVGGSVFSAKLFSRQQMGAVAITGDLSGEFGKNAQIVGNTADSPKIPPTDLAIKSVKVGGTVSFADILAGYDLQAGVAAQNPDAQIGAITVGKDWIASNAVAGVKDVAVNGFGNADDAKIPPGVPDNAGIISRIASISIKGQVIGTPDSLSAADHFGFVAQEIGSFTLGGVKLSPLTKDVKDPAIELSLITGDVTIREVSL